MELDFKKYDIVDAKEAKLEEIVFMQNPKNANVKGLTKYIDEKDKLMLHTLLSIMFKLRSKAIYTKDKMPKSVESKETIIKETERIIGSLHRDLKRNRYDNIKDFIQEKNPNNFRDFRREKKYINRQIIGDLLYRYYLEKNTSYIGSKLYIKTLLDQNSAKEILTINPFMIGELLDYQQKPLTKEELIIQEVMDYLIEAEQNYANPDDVIKYTIELLEQNNKGFGLKENKILYIISNVYQESKERNDSFYGKMLYILENTKYEPHKIIDYLNKNNNILIEIIEKFTDYNMYLEEGRLEELEQKPSAEYAKRIYRKNP